MKKSTGHKVGQVRDQTSKINVTKKKKTAKGSTDKNKKTVAKRSYTNKELERIRAYTEKNKNKPIKYKFKRDESGTFVLNIEKKNIILAAIQSAEAFGTSDDKLQHYYLNQVIQTFNGMVSSEGFDYSKLEEFVNIMIMILHCISPKDATESMLAIQMIGVHNLAMETLKKAMIQGQTFEGTQANVSQATKMLRTYIAQLEALNKYRTGGHQKMTVEHVHVNKGGKAIVGNISQEGGRGKVEK